MDAPNINLPLFSMVHVHDTKLHLFIVEIEKLLPVPAEQKAFGVHMSTANLASDLIMVTSDPCPPQICLNTVSPLHQNCEHTC